MWVSSSADISALRNVLSEDKFEDLANKSEVKLAEMDLGDLDLLNAETHTAKIEYENEELRIYIDDLAGEPTARLNVKLSELIALDNGSAHVGFVQETQFTHNFCELFNWSLVSSSTSHYRDSWSGLSLEYTAHWPLHLIFAPEGLEKYNNLFRFLFPLRKIQHEL